MSLAPLALLFLAVLVTGYVVYGRWIERQFALDDGRTTPAHAVAVGRSMRSPKAIPGSWSTLQDR